LEFKIVDKTNLILVDIPTKSDPRALFTLETCTDLFWDDGRNRNGYYYSFQEQGQVEWSFREQEWEVVPSVSPTRPRTWLFGGPFETKRFFDIHAVLPDEPIRTVPKNKILAIP